MSFTITMQEDEDNDEDKHDNKPKFKIRLKIHHDSPLTERRILPKVRLKTQHNFLTTDNQILPKIKLQLKTTLSKENNIQTDEQKTLQPFWTFKTAQLTNLFWSPTKDNCIDLKTHIPIHSWTMSLIQKQKIYNQALTDQSVPLIKMLPQTSHPMGGMIARKIRIFPTIEDKIKLKKIFGASRYVYNRGVVMIQSEKQKYLSTHEKQEGTLLQRLRINLVHNQNYQKEELNWMLTDLPSDSRDSVIKELDKNYWNAVSTHHQFELKKKSKKHSQSLNIRLRDYDRQNGFYSFLRLMDKAELFPETEYDFKLHVDEDGNYYLIVNYKLSSNHPMTKLQRSKKTRRKHKLRLKKKKQKNARHHRVNVYQKTINPKIRVMETSDKEQPQTLGGESQTPKTSERSLSGDLGCRTFLTCYTPDGYVYHIGTNDIQVLYRLFHYKNKLQGKISKSKGKRKRRMIKARVRLSKRIHNLVDDFHKKTARWLLDNFSTLIIPKLDVNQFNKKKTSKTIRNKMRLWRHCSFIDCLKNKQRFYPESHLIIPSEEYTSKTCSQCGCQHKNLGRNKTFLCPNPNCQQIFDRDVNASLNILLKTLTETTSVVL